MEFPYSFLVNQIANNRPVIALPGIHGMAYKKENKGQVYYFIRTEKNRNLGGFASKLWVFLPPMSTDGGSHNNYWPRVEITL